MGPGWPPHPPSEERRPGLLLALIHRSAWKEYSPKFAEKVPKLAHLGYALSYGVGYKGRVHQAFSDHQGGVRRYDVRGGGSAGGDHNRLGGVRDVPAGASLAVRPRP